VPQTSRAHLTVAGLPFPARHRPRPSHFPSLPFQIALSTQHPILLAVVPSIHHPSPSTPPTLRSLSPSRSPPSPARAAADVVVGALRSPGKTLVPSRPAGPRSAALPWPPLTSSLQCRPRRSSCSRRRRTPA